MNSFENFAFFNNGSHGSLVWGYRVTSMRVSVLALCFVRFEPPKFAAGHLHSIDLLIFAVSRSFQ